MGLFAAGLVGDGMAGLTFGSKRMQGWSFVELFADER